MSTFSILTAVSMVPMEETAFTDTTQKAKTVHSVIDRGVSGSRERATGSTSTSIQLFQTTIAEGEEYQLSEQIGGILTNVMFLGIVISAAPSGISEDATSAVVSIDAGNTYPIVLTGVGASVVLPFSSFAVGNIVITGNTGTSATLDILVGLT